MFLEPGTVRSFAADDEDDVVPALQPARSINDEFKTLLSRDIA